MSLRQSSGAIARLISTSFAVAAVATACGEKSIPPRVDEATLAADEARAKAEKDAARAELDRLLTGGEEVFALSLANPDLPSGAKVERLPEEAAPARWRVEDGWLRNDDAKNQGLWIEALPAEDVPVRIEFVAKSRKPPGNRPFPGDIKCEAFATEPRHEAGYSFINGGWSNQFDTIARLGEHSADDRRKVAMRVEEGREYRYAIIRRGARLDWVRDGELLYTYEDAAPVRGRWFGFNNWLSDVSYKDFRVFRITP
jgi:hypothetical protein